MGGPGSGRKKGSGSDNLRKANNSLKQKKALFGSSNKQTLQARKKLHYQKMIANRSK